jgi:hypothetical protein
MAEAIQRRSNCALSLTAPDGATPRSWSMSAPEFPDIVLPRL